MKTEIEMARAGEFLRTHNPQDFVVASEALNIGRVKWNMVPIGKKGQGDIVFYLTTDQMLALCAEILDGKFAEKITADKGAYPNAYAYKTGEDGSLRLAIGGGNVGCRIQMRNLKAKPQLNYTVAVSMESMSTMARKYMLCTGLMPVVPGSYYASVVEAFEKGRRERAKFYKQPSDEEIGDVIDSNSVVDESVLEQAPSTEEVVVSPEKPVESEKESEKKDASTSDTKITNEASESDVYTLTLRGEKSLKKGFYVFEGTADGGEKISLMFRKDDAEKLAWFAKFENAAALGDTALKIRGEKKGNFILYKGPAKK